jgi:hypothetical protein
MGNASGLWCTPLSMIPLSSGLLETSANTMSATLWLRAERLDGVAVDTVLSGAVGVGPATAAVVSTRAAPRTGARISAYRIADLAEPQVCPNGAYSALSGALLSQERLWQAKSHTSKRDASPHSHSSACRSSGYSPTPSPVKHDRDEARRPVLRQPLARAQAGFGAPQGTNRVSAILIDLSIARSIVINM